MDWSDLDIQIKHNSKRFVTTCPKCSKDRKKKSSPCLTVNNEEGNRWWNCHHCGWSGNLDIYDKYDRVREESKIPPQETMLGIKSREYLKKRGISILTAKKLKLYDQERGNRTLLSWPVFMNITLVNAKFLDIGWTKDSKGPKWFQLKKDYGTRTIPIGMHLLKTRDTDGNRPKNLTLIFTEGEIDMATWLECGYENVISTPQGAPNPESKNFDQEFAYLHDKYVKSVLDEFDMIILSVDNDKPGKNLAHHMGIILGKERCRIMKYPVGYKDINEVFMGDEKKGLKPLGKEGVDGCRQNLSSFPISGIINVYKVADELKRFREKGFERGLLIGDETVDRHLSMKRKLLYEFIGIPGSGKSVWIRDYLIKLIQHNPDENLKFAMFSPESRPASREYAKISEAFTGKSIEKNKWDSMSDELFKKAMMFINKHFFIIAPDKKNFESFDNKDNKKDNLKNEFNNSKITPDRINTLESILKYVAYLKATENIYGFVIDPWNKIESERPRNETETEYAGKQLDKIIYFSDYYDVAAILMIHPTKTDSIGMNFKMPTLYSAKGSSAFYERADVGVIIHRNKMKKKKNIQVKGDEDEDDLWDYNSKAPCIIKVEKQKFEEIGREGKFKMELRNKQFHVIDSNVTVEKKKEEPKPKDTGNPDKFIEPTIFDDIEDVDNLPF